MTDREKFMLFVASYLAALRLADTPLSTLQFVLEHASRVQDAVDEQQCLESPQLCRDGVYMVSTRPSPETRAWEFVSWSLGLGSKPAWYPRSK